MKMTAPKMTALKMYGMGDRPKVLTPAAEWRLDEGAGQRITDYSGNANHGINGSTTGVDTNDFAWTAKGILPGADDYGKMPLCIDPNNDFTVMVSCEVPAAAPAAIEWVLSCGNSDDANPYCGILRSTTGALSGRVTTVSASYYATILTENVVSGDRFLVFKRIGGVIYLKDLVSGKFSQVSVSTVGNIYNKIIIGALGRTGTSANYTHGIYFVIPFKYATTDAEDWEMYRYVQAMLGKRGVNI